MPSCLWVCPENSSAGPGHPGRICVVAGAEARQTILPADATRPRTGFGAGPRLQDYSGGVLLSQGDSPQVPSALAGLTSVFGMGTGVTPPLWPPETVLNGRTR